MDAIEASNQIVLIILPAIVVVILGAIFGLRIDPIRTFSSRPIALVFIISIMLLWVITGGVHI